MNWIIRHIRSLARMATGRKSVPLAFYRRGFKASRTGNHTLAIQSFRAVLASWPDFRPAQRGLLQSLNAEGATQEAETLSHAVLSAHPDDQLALMTLGLGARRLGQHEQAASWFQKVVDAHPGFSQARMALASELFAMGELARSESLCREIIGKEADHRQALMTLGTLERKKGNHKQALEWLRAATKAHPDFLEARAETAVTLKDLGRYAEAEAICKTILSKDARNRRALVTFAQIPSKLGNHELSLERFDVLRQALPDAFARQITHFDESKMGLTQEILQKAAAVFQSGDKDCERQIDAICSAYAHAANPNIGGADIGAVLSFLKSLNGSSQRRNRIVWTEDAKLFVAEAPGADDVIITFRTGIPAPILDAFLARYHCSHIHFDAEKGLNWGLTGVEGFSASLEATIVSVRDIIDQIGAKRIIVAGYSGFGLTAINYGLALGAELVLAFSAVTNFQVPFVAKLYQDKRANILARKLQKTVDPSLLDARATLSRAQNPPVVKLFYGEHNHRDSSHARYLEGLDCVSMEVLSCHTHESMLFMLHEGSLQATFDQAMRHHA
nr:tetratricopeptide repeat protein [uncultured Cohaesibacter sp.]